MAAAKKNVVLATVEALSPEKRAHLVPLSLKGLNCELLFALAVAVYDQSPTKKKACAIYGTFVDEKGPWNGLVGEFEPKSQKGQAILLDLRARIDWMNELRAKAQKMNLLSRIFSSGDRAVAVAGMFGPFLETAGLLAGEGALKELLLDRKVAGIGDWLTRAKTAKKALVDAGFNASFLGLTTVT